MAKGSGPADRLALRAGRTVPDQIAFEARSAGLKRFFCTNGRGPYVDALRALGLHGVVCHRASVAVAMAVGYGRSLGQPALVTLDVPELRQAVPALGVARDQEVDLVVLAAECTPEGAAPLALATDDRDVLRTSIRSFHRPRRPGQAVVEFSGALRGARGRLPGPRVVQLPGPLADSAAPECRAAHGPPRAEIREDVAAAVAQAVRGPSRAALWLGPGAAAPGAAAAALRLAEFLHLPVAVDPQARGLIPDAHPLFIGVVGPESSPGAALVREAERLLVVGSAGNPSVALAPGCHVTVLDHDADRVDAHTRVDAAVVAPIAAAIEAAVAQAAIPVVEAMMARRAWIDRRRNAPDMKALGIAPFPVAHVGPALQRALPQHTAVVGRSTPTILSCVEHMAVRTATEWFLIDPDVPDAAATGLGHALGAEGTRPTLIVCELADVRALGFELQLARKHRLPVTFAILQTPDEAEASASLLEWVEAMQISCARVRHGAQLEGVLRRPSDGPRVLTLEITDGSTQAQARRSHG